MSSVFMNELFKRKTKVLLKNHSRYPSSRSPRRCQASQIDISKLDVERRLKSPINIGNKSQLFIAELLQKQTNNRVSRHSSRQKVAPASSKAGSIITSNFSPQNAFRYSKTPINIRRKDSYKMLVVETKSPIARNQSKKEEDLPKISASRKRSSRTKGWRIRSQESIQTIKEAESQTPLMHCRRKEPSLDDWVISAW